MISEITKNDICSHMAYVLRKGDGLFKLKPSPIKSDHTINQVEETIMELMPEKHLKRLLMMFCCSTRNHFFYISP